jgi:hypothetical protein
MTAQTDMVYVVQRQLKLGGRIFDRGCEVTAAELGRNLESFLRTGSVSYLPRNRAAAGVNKPRDLPAPTPPRPKVEVCIVHDPDPRISWRKSWAETAKRSGCDPETAKNLLFGTDRGSRLYMLATRIDAEHETKLAGRRIARAL